MNINLMPDEDERELLKLRDGMSEKQRQDMAEIIQNELKRRETIAKSSSQGTMPSYKSAVKSSKMSNGLTASDMEDIYKDSDKNIQELRVKALESKLNEAKREVSRLGVAGSKLPKKKHKTSSQGRAPISGIVNSSMSKLPIVLLVILLVGLGTVKFNKSFLTSSTLQEVQAADNKSARGSLADPSPGSIVGDKSIESDLASEKSVDTAHFTAVSSSAERGFLMQLDQRRVELERRKQLLDDKEKEIQSQAQLVSEKVTELKTLINKLASVRKEKDHKYEARMEQLASVYSAMAPNEAANLISRLDEEVGLGLLERMPGKRMAQILGVMDQSRALEMTKSLTDKKKL
jgi:flagellar motility protein MotE (MotC chaperone)